ncbi:MAG: nuclease-related domain-containing protein [Candidatus Promineifilaceae bacterium]
MILVKRTATDLAAGFTEFSAFQQRLKDDWEPRFLRRHLQRQEKYRVARQQYTNKSWFQRLLTPPPTPPKIRRFSTLYDQYYWPAWLQWITTLSSTPQLEIPIAPNAPGELKFGKKGERKMLHWLAARLDDRYLAACRLHTKHLDKADIDAIVVGPKGYWYFEVKNWKGSISGEGENNWTHVSKNGDIKTKASPIWVWKVVAGEIGRLLRPLWNNKTPHIQPNGGVAFTVDAAQCRLEIKDPSTVKGGHTVKWGHLSPYWENQLQTAPDLKAATPTLTFQILDALLTKNQSLEKPKNKFSTAAHAKKLIRQTETRLKSQLK